MPLLLVHGDNILEIDEAIRVVRQRFESPDVLTFEAADASFTTISGASRTSGLFDPRRLVIVHDLHQRLGPTAKDKLDDNEVKALLEDLPDTTTLLLVSRDMQRDHALIRMVQAAGGEVKAHIAPKKYEMPGWVIARARNRGVAIERAAADLLADLAGANPLLLDSELEKLTTYAGEDGRITPDMVESLVSPVTQDSIFALVDAVAGGDRAKAFRLLHSQLENTSTTSMDFALYLIRMLARQMRILLRIRLAQEVGRKPNQIVEDLKIPRYYTDRYFSQVKRLPKDRLTLSFEQLAALEHALKTGKADPATGLDLLVVELCA